MKRILLIATLLLIGAGCLMMPIKLGIIIKNENIIKSSFGEGIAFPSKILQKPCWGGLFLLGSHELKILQTNGKGLVKHIEYELKGYKVNLLNIDSSIYIANSEIHYVGLMDSFGKLVWKYPLSDSKQLFTNEIVGGDLNEDGVFEFYVATNKGLHVLDNKGNQNKTYLADKPLDNVKINIYNNYSQLITLDYINGKIFILDTIGELVKTIDLGNRPIWDLSVINWPAENYLLLKDGNNFYVMDFDGRFIFRENVGLGIIGIAGTGVFFNNNENYLAVLTQLKSVYSKSILWIYSPKGKLIYKEAINSTEAITAVKDQSSNKEYLLVGGWNSIDKYEMR